MKLSLSKRSLLALAALLVGALVVIYSGPQAQFAPMEPLTGVQSIETLRTQFNHDAGKIRLIMLLSPT
jgi:hypothetical protein